MILFLAAVGYSLAEIQGKHHSMFVASGERDSSAYREFWASLNRGEFQSAEYKRFGKGGKEVWILASYNPILDDTGKPFKVVKFASDVSAQKLKTADFEGQIEAIGKSQAVIEFDMEGMVLDANANFLGALGYSLGEIRGRHHSLFVPPDQRDSEAYRAFWANLKRGEFQSGEFRRLGKGGRGGLDPGFLQSDPRPERQAVQGGEICHRHHRAGGRAQEERNRAQHDGGGRRRRRPTQLLGSGNLRRDDEIERHRIGGRRPGRGCRPPGAAPLCGGGIDEQHRAV